MRRYAILPALAGMSLAVGCAGQGGNSGAAAASANDWGNAVRSAADVSQTTGRSGAALRTAGSLAGHPLVQQLTRQLGVAPEQAAGGAGLLFQTARQRMAPEQFKALEQSVPGVDQLMAAAPKTGQTSGGLSSLMGGAGDTVNQAANLIQGFRQLNLSSDMVSQFIPVVVNYVKETGGNALASALQAALVGG
ncbi:hypothetical protein MIN45_P0446 [Methylomarinovum tepidoasis]|uniref:DUF2780 domain-containing protein n=1 Tax=Methylomarinovum tepidoasis TaxID=2840183 RepID=A0AAU9CVF2_9GAMM|nr:DUF2780 domain-containing protein [Methylomarinovum sp. IN45]BCX88079.1 hypothetical protein MIN45_P0446 [Methylomarinovum sp. IN45]